MTETTDAAGTIDDADRTTIEYRMPSLGADMDDGTIVEWRVAVGDEVHRGDVAAVVATDKSDIDIEIWHGGVVEELLVPAGERVDVGTPIALLRVAPGDAPATEPTAEPTAEPVPTAEVEPAGTPAERPVEPRPGDRPAPGHVPASPRARRLAEQRGVDLADVAGSGPGGAVVYDDVVAAADAVGASTTRRPVDRSRMRSLIAERMTRANREIPHYHLSRDVDVGAMLARLEQLNTERSVADRLLPAAMYVRAVALAAARHPEFNGFWIDDGFQPADAVNVAMAISLRSGGLVTPHVADAATTSLDDTMAVLTELVTAARRGTLRASWMTGGTITITNLGDTGADLVHGVISPPQVALVGFGRVRPRPWVVDDAVVARPVLTVTLAADHRATDGAGGSRFLGRIASHLEEPETL